MRCVNRRELASGGGGGGGGEDVEARVSPPHGADGGAAVVRVESPVSPARDGVEPPVDGMVNLGSPLRKRAHRAVTTPVADAEMADADERHIVVRRGRRVAPTCLFASAGGLHDPFGHIRHLSKKEFAFTNAEALVLSLFDDEQGEWWGTVRKCMEAVDFEGAWVCECLFETRAREVTAEYLAYIRAKLARLADGMLFDSASKAASLLSLMQPAPAADGVIAVRGRTCAVPGCCIPVSSTRHVHGKTAMLTTALALRLAGRATLYLWRRGRRADRGPISLADKIVADVEDSGEAEPGIRLCYHHDAQLALLKEAERMFALFTEVKKGHLFARVKRPQTLPVVPAETTAIMEYFLTRDEVWLRKHPAECLRVFGMKYDAARTIFLTCSSVIVPEAVRLGHRDYGCLTVDVDRQWREWVAFWLRTRRGLEYFVVGWLVDWHPDHVSHVFVTWIHVVALLASLYGWAVSHRVRHHIQPRDVVDLHSSLSFIDAVFDNTNIEYQFSDAQDKRDSYSNNKGYGLTWVVTCSLLGMFIVSYAFMARGTDDRVAEYADLLYAWAFMSTFGADRGYGSMWKWVVTVALRLMMYCPAFKNGPQFVRTIIAFSAKLANVRMVVEHKNAHIKERVRLLV